MMFMSCLANELLYENIYKKSLVLIIKHVFMSKEWELYRLSKW